MASIEFWVSIGSTYSYLSVARMPAIEAAGTKVAWRPFSVRAIMLEIGNVPFVGKPVKAAYMWRDIARRAAAHGLKPNLPAPYPLSEFDLANRVAIVAETEGWCRDYIRETYRRWFELGEAAGGRANLDATLASLGHDPEAVIDRANTGATEAAYLAATEEARGHGIFGSPSFVVGDELFWGDDRLDEAVEWARRGGPPEGIS
jgi:2-hydroxychromene-2-carboxylate isomerase